MKKMSRSNWAVLFAAWMCFATAAVAGIDDGLVAYYRMDEASGSLVDSTGHGHMGAVHGTPTYSQPGTISDSISFKGGPVNGSGDYFSIPNSSAFSSEFITVSFWMNASMYDPVYGAANVLRILGKADNEPPYSGWRFHLANNKYGWHLGSTVQVWSVIAPTLNNWHFVCGVSGPSNIWLYVDGVKYNSPSIASVHTCTSPLEIGRYSSGGWAYYRGRLDEIRIYNRALTSYEVSQLYNGGGAGLFSGATDLGGGWKWLNWFGYFANPGSGWIYHNEHGWMFCSGTTASSIWMWTPDLGWLWTAQGVYPSLYRLNLTCWLWYQTGSHNPRWFYYVCAGQWMSDAPSNSLAGTWRWWKNETYVKCGDDAPFGYMERTVTVTQQDAEHFSFPAVLREPAGVWVTVRGTLSGNHVEMHIEQSDYPDAANYGDCFVGTLSDNGYQMSGTYSNGPLNDCHWRGTWGASKY